MSLPVVLQPAASQDAAAAREYYEAKRIGLGFEFVKRLREVIERIGTVPELHGSVWPNVRAARLRQFMHVVYYRTHTDRIEVVAILHGSQDDIAWQSRIGQ